MINVHNKIKLIGCLVLLACLFGCGSGAADKGTDTVTDTNTNADTGSNTNVEEIDDIPKILTSTSYGEISSWFINPQYYDGVPKYSGPMGTYTNKHIPIAIKANGDIYQVYSDNTRDFALRIYAKKNDEAPVLVHEELNWSDPHMNASINIDKSGYLNVHVSARSMVRTSKIYKSKTPYCLCFELIDDTRYEAYPQLHNATWGYTVMSNKYEYNSDNKQVRTIVSRTPKGTTKLVNGGHYQITDYVNGNLYSAYNYHPDGAADLRQNIYLMKSSDGVNWTNIHAKNLTLPIVADSALTKIYDSQHNFIFLKDIRLDKQDGISILFVESNSIDPTQGQRYLKQWTQAGIKTIAEVGHNYNSGTYFYDKGQLYVVAITQGVKSYLGGNAALYQRINGEFVFQYELTDQNYSYLRAIRNAALEGIVSVGASNIPTGKGAHYQLQIENDDDKDGMASSWEVNYGLDPFSASDAQTDADGDGLSNLEEYTLKTDPKNTDTDEDGFSDFVEVQAHKDPTSKLSKIYVHGDYDGDNKADLFVRNVAELTHYIKKSATDKIAKIPFGDHAEDIPLIGDFDGDGFADVVVRRPSTSMWYIRKSTNRKDIEEIKFGLESTDIPVLADYDGDGLTDIAVRRASNFTWYILNSSNGEIQRIPFGLSVDDIPVPADYDGDGKADLAVRRPSTKEWFILNSSGTNYKSELGDGIQRYNNLGLQQEDIPVPADYDGDGIADIAVRRPSTSMWYILNSSDGEIQRIKFGLEPEDIPIPADFDGDGKTDITVRRSRTFYWYILNSSDGEVQRKQFGYNEHYIPTLAPILQRMKMLADIEKGNLSNSAVMSENEIKEQHFQESLKFEYLQLTTE